MLTSGCPLRRHKVAVQTTRPLLALKSRENIILEQLWVSTVTQVLWEGKCSHKMKCCLVLALSPWLHCQFFEDKHWVSSSLSSWARASLCSRSPTTFKRQIWGPSLCSHLTLSLSSGRHFLPKTSFSFSFCNTSLLQLSTYHAGSSFISFAGSSSSSSQPLYWCDLGHSSWPFSLRSILSPEISWSSLWSSNTIYRQMMPKFISAALTYLISVFWCPISIWN